MTLLVVFFVAFNLFAGVLMTSGVAGMIGIDANVGGDDAIEERTNRDNVDTGTGQGDTLFGLRNIIGDQVANVFGVIFPGLAMLKRAGVPGVLIGGFLGPLFSVFMSVALLSYFRGWDL